MRHLCWIYWLFWAGLPTPLTAYPVSPLFLSDSHQDDGWWQWERYWIRYTIGFLSLTVTAVTLAGCLCCQRHRRPKGFQDKTGKCKQEFKNGNTNGQDSTCEQPPSTVELDVPQMIALNDRVQFEPLPIHRVIPGPKISSPSKPLPLLPSYFEEHDQDDSALQDPYREWFTKEELHVPREKLKYLREIGRGWFGKVVEGRADLEDAKGTLKHGGVVVRILTEDASSREKVWFLGEAIPYLKMQHQNVLALLGFCLETDPYLLLFESCSVGDLKGFLLSNRDHRSQEALLKENIPTRMALEIAAGLHHMHSHGLAHTDLSARNCLVASDLSAKLGDYGIGVEKYPEDYYIVGDRALPIRWSAPESLDCTDTTIETREITSLANIWSYAIFLWEILTWGERPYNSMSDEQVIQMLLSLKTDFLPNHVQILESYLQKDSQPDILHIYRLCLSLDISKRPSLDMIRQMLLNEHFVQEDFEQRWENLKTDTSKQRTRSASLQDLRGSIDSDYWASIINEKLPCALQSSFRLGPDEPVKNVSGVQNAMILPESGSETEEESWRGQIERGVYTEKVRQKSKSVTDLMVLVHIDFDSDAECSLGPQVSEKPVKKKLPSTSSDSDLRHITLANEFDEALKKLKDSLDASNKTKLLDNSEWPKLLTLTTDQGQTPILRLSLDPKENLFVENLNPVSSSSGDNTHSEQHVLRLLSKGDPNLPLLRYIPDEKSAEEKSRNTTDSIPATNTYLEDKEDVNLCFSNNFSVDDLETNQNSVVDVILWNHALDSALEQKTPGFADEAEFNEYIESSNAKTNNTVPKLVVPSTSVPETSQSCREDSVCNIDEDLSNAEDLEIERKDLPNEHEEERKHLSTPDDEQSSDSGFRDKESCEEEEGLCPSSVLSSSMNISTINAPTCTEEEQLKVLFELDTILDAEYYAILPELDATLEDSNSVRLTETELLKHKECISDVTEIRNSVADEIKITEVTNCIDTVTQTAHTLADAESEVDIKSEHIKENGQHHNGCSPVSPCSSDGRADPSSNVKSDDDVTSVLQDSEKNDSLLCTRDKTFNAPQESEQWTPGEYYNENEDEDSSTMSLRSDNSYVSFGMEDEFVTAIRNELREKLPRAQMPVVEPSELLDEKTTVIESNIANKAWDDEESEESSDQSSGGLDISIRYNIYGTPLSPILEERESTATSESLISNSQDASIASKESAPSEDVLVVDTRTHRMMLLEGLDGGMMQDEDRDTTNGDISEEETTDCNFMDRQSETKFHMKITSGCAPLPSPEEESKWQQISPSFPLPLPLPVQDELMSTSFTMEQDWVSQDEEEEDDEEEDENSSSSGEFVWKRYNEHHVEQIQIRSTLNNEEVAEENTDLEEEMDAEDEEEEEEEEVEEEEEEFTPSAWNATLAPHRSALRSPDKAVKPADQKKSVWFKKQRYHCVYEYPKETLPPDGQGPATTTWEPTSYTDWEEMMDEPKLDLYPLDYDDVSHTGNEEFYVSSSNRPFQFQSSDTKYVSQFFPGASSTAVPVDQDEVDGNRQERYQDNQVFLNEQDHSQYQLGELRHTRDRLKLNLLSSNGAVSASLAPARPNFDESCQPTEVTENHDLKDPENIDEPMQNQLILPNAVNNTTLPEVPHDNQQNIKSDPASVKSNDPEKCGCVESSDKRTVAMHD